MWTVLGIMIYLTMLSSSDAACSAELDRLLALHDSYGLPHPPKDASLVLFVAGREIWTDPHAKWIPGVQPTLGFSQDGRTVLDEFGRPFEVKSIRLIKPDPTAFKEDVRLGNIDDAVLYHARGWKALARTTFRKWLADSLWTPERDLQFRAWDYWICRLHHDPDMPLATIAKRLKQLYPHFVGTGFESDYQALLKSLDLSLKPSKSKPGSDEALIDALIEARGEEPFDSGQSAGFRLDPRYRALLRRGLDAVPALIAHLGDDRLVRGYSRVCGCGEDLRVRHIVFDILMQMNGGSIIGGWRGVLDSGLPNEWPEEIGKWYAAARKLGEEKFVLSRVLGEGEDDDEFHPWPLQRLAEKYPRHLPDVFRKAIDTRKNHARFAWEYAKAVAGAVVPNADKRKVLEYAAKQDERTVRAAGVYYLRRFDPKLAKERLLQGLADMPANASDLEDAGLAFIVAEGSDPDEWKALAAAARRADATGEVTLVCAVLCAKSPEGRLPRLAFLLEYLTDDLSADAREDRLTRSEARHIAAGHVAALRRIETKPYPMDWVADLQWAELREQVKEVLWP